MTDFLKARMFYNVYVVQYDIPANTLWILLIHLHLKFRNSSKHVHLFIFYKYICYEIIISVRDFYGTVIYFSVWISIDKMKDEYLQNNVYYMFNIYIYIQVLYCTSLKVLRLTTILTELSKKQMEFKEKYLNIIPASVAIAYLRLGTSKNSKKYFIICYYTF